VPNSSIIRLQPAGPKQELDRWDDIPASDIETGQPIQRGHYYIQDKKHGFAAGVWDCTAFTTKRQSYDFHEFMLILDGTVTVVEEDGRETTVRPGDSFIVPRGVVHRWIQPGYLRKYFVTFEGRPASESDAALRVVSTDLRAELGTSAPPPADLLLGPVPAQRDCASFTDGTGQWAVGLWDSTAYHRKPIAFPRHELMHLLEGSVTLTDDTGKSHQFGAGDSFLVPLGAVCDWRCEGYLRKIYCSFQPSPGL
jgi:uncharacterized cupin superfamily protein